MTFPVSMTNFTITVLFLLGFLVLVFIQTNSEFLVVFNVSKLEGCLISDKSFLSLVPLAINQCAEECFLRPKCLSLKYNKRFHLCELLESTRNGLMPTAIQEQPGCVYLRKSDIRNQSASVCDSCVTGETCDTVNLRCVKQECRKMTKLNATNGDVFGNMNSNGSRVKYICNPGYIRYTQNPSTCDSGMWNTFPLCLADLANLTNVALNKPTSMSSIFGNKSSERGVDGNTRQLYTANTCFHTQRELRPWWQVDLQAVYSIQHVRLYNRMDCCANRTVNAILLLGKTLANIVAVRYKEGQIDDVQDFSISGAVEARYVNLTLNTTTFLHLCEVQVFGTLRVPTIGRTCMQDSDCLETAGQCIYGLGATTGKCFCNMLYRYNSTSRDCEKACTTILDTFKEYQQRYIVGYSTIVNYKTVSSFDECKIGCVTNSRCMFFEISGTSGTWSLSLQCSMGTVSLEMIKDTNPAAFLTYGNWNLYSRDCQ